MWFTSVCNSMAIFGDFMIEFTSWFSIVIHPIWYIWSNLISFHAWLRSLSLMDLNVSNHRHAWSRSDGTGLIPSHTSPWMRRYAWSWPRSVWRKRGYLGNRRCLRYVRRCWVPGMTNFEWNMMWFCWQVLFCSVLAPCALAHASSSVAAHSLNIACLKRKQQVNHCETIGMGLGKKQKTVNISPKNWKSISFLHVVVCPVLLWMSQAWILPPSPAPEVIVGGWHQRSLESQVRGLDGRHSSDQGSLAPRWNLDEHLGHFLMNIWANRSFPHHCCIPLSELCPLNSNLTGLRHMASHP